MPLTDDNLARLILIGSAGYLPFLVFPAWDSAEPAAVLEAFPVRPSLRTLLAAAAALGDVFLSAMYSSPLTCDVSSHW
jgi:hypothetical protein